MDENFSIRNLKTDNQDDILKLINEYWNSNHIFLKSKSLFKWQYEGYGINKGHGFPSLYDGNELIGFRGVYPAEIRIASNDANCEVEPLSIGSLYLVIPRYRGMKLGYALQQYTTSSFHNYMAIGSNLNTSSPIYKKSNYFILDKMYRYLVPLSMLYTDLLIDKNGDMNLNIRKCMNVKDINPVMISSDELEKFWNHSISGQPITSLNKSKDFWEWRYINSPIYKYLFWGGTGKGGIIVARVANIYNDKKEILPTKVFRILELIPENSDVWNRKSDTRFNNLLISVLNWAQLQGCTVGEFYCSTNRFQDTLEEVGFKEVTYNPENSRFDMVSNYEPCATGKLTNISLSLENWRDDFDFNNTYFTLSDADQDRPNIMPK